MLVAKRPIQEREAEEPPPKKPMENASTCSEFAPDNKQELKVRRVKIKREMLESFGYTRGCSGCIGIQRGLQTRGHSEECRRRIETRLREQGHEGLARAEKRMQQSRSLQRSKLQAATETKHGNKKKRTGGTSCSAVMMTHGLWSALVCDLHRLSIFLGARAASELGSAASLAV